MEPVALSADEKEGSSPKRRRVATPGVEMSSMPSVEGCAADFVSIHEAFDRLVEAHGDQPAVEDGSGMAWTYTELRDASIRMAKNLAAVAATGVDTDVGRLGDNTSPMVVAVLMRRRCSWVAACLASARLGLPLLALSGDLGSEDEAKRNTEALREHRPRVLVVDDVTAGASTGAGARLLAESAVTGGKELLAPQVVSVDALLAGDISETTFSFSGRAARSPDDALYLVYTGGTTSASKCVAVTHRMALHELDVYPKISPLGCTDRVLHQTPAYWGATSLGIFDIAWACGACLVLADGGAGPQEVRETIRSRRCTVAGVVPSVLEALDEDEDALQSLRLVFTWGEALQEATAARWSRKVALFDLLIATEYWLILCAQHGSGGRGGFRPVPGARLTLLRPDKEADGNGIEHDEDCGGNGKSASLVEVAEGEVGELYLAGPMVSALGYTDSERNAAAFVDLPLGPNSTNIRHFRTRDLARRLSDGSLEYCGRADGFAKVGGRWLDLASVETQLRSAGCKQAALVWDENTKRRHAAVVLESVSVPDRSLAARSAALQRLLPPETHLHVLPELPRHPTTGKVHRGALAPRLAAAVGSTVQDESSACLVRVRRALVIGLLLAARTGVRGALLLSMALGMAPGLESKDSWGSIPKGLRSQSRKWCAWHRAFMKLGTSMSALRAMPYVTLLFLDSYDTGLWYFKKLIDAPIGSIGMALLICRRAQPWLRTLLAAAGAARARRARGGEDAWPWVYWVGLPTQLEQWLTNHDTGYWRFRRWDDMPQAVEALRRYILKADGKDMVTEVRRCSNCWSWDFEGEIWRQDFYCAGCSEGWKEYKERMAAEGNPVQSPRTTPEDTPRRAEEKWTAGVDTIDFDEVETQKAQAHAPASNRTNVALKVAAATSPVGRVVEKSTGISASEADSSLTSLESLKVIALVSSLRRELGCDIGASDVAKCTSLVELEKLCASAPRMSVGKPVGNGVDVIDDRCETDWKVFATPRFWKAPVGWLVRLHDMPDKECMRIACRALIRRHIGLRADPWQGARNEDTTHLCNHVAPVLIALRALYGKLDGGLCDKAAHGIFHAWPRISLLPEVSPATSSTAPAEEPLTPRQAQEAEWEKEMIGVEEAFFQWHQCSTEEEMRKHAWLRARSRGFKTPASIAVLVVAGGSKRGKDTAYLHLSVNHAMCDASCIVPLVTDLLALHRAAAGRAANGDKATEETLEAAALPQLSHALALQQERLRKALAGTPLRERDDAMDLTHGVFTSFHSGYDHYMRLLPGACRLLETGAAVIGVPPDHLLVAALACAFGRVGEFVNSVKVSLIVPMRDGRGEGQLIGNLASTRHMKVHVRAKSLFAVASELSTCLRRREWGLCDFLNDDCDRLFINLRSIPRLEGASPEVEKVDTTRSSSAYVRNMVEMFADQETDDQWTFSMGIRDDMDGGAFADTLRRVLWSMAVDPLSPAVCSFP